MGFFWGGVRCLLVVEKKMDLGTKQGRKDRLFFCANTTDQREGIVGNTYIQTCMLYLVKQVERWQHKLMWTC